MASSSCSLELGRLLLEVGAEAVGDLAGFRREALEPRVGLGRRGLRELADQVRDLSLRVGRVGDRGLDRFRRGVERGAERLDALARRLRRFGQNSCDQRRRLFFREGTEFHERGLRVCNVRADRPFPAVCRVFSRVFPRKGLQTGQAEHGFVSGTARHGFQRSTWFPAIHTAEIVLVLRMSCSGSRSRTTKSAHAPFASAADAIDLHRPGGVQRGGPQDLCGRQSGLDHHLHFEVLEVSLEPLRERTGIGAHDDEDAGIRRFLQIAPRDRQRRLVCLRGAGLRPSPPAAAAPAAARRPSLSASRRKNGSAKNAGVVS